MNQKQSEEWRGESKLWSMLPNDLAVMQKEFWLNIVLAAVVRKGYALRYVSNIFMADNLKADKGIVLATVVRHSES
jgi:hypothetical protein